jgi:uncharacterized Zn-binding protein involved in type VI secretion
MPAPVLLGDPHVCLKQDPGPKPHVGGPVGPTLAVTSVEVNGRPVAVVGDKCVCASPDQDSLSVGITSVEIGGKAAADSSAKTAHGGTIVSTCTDVTFG